MVYSGSGLGEMSRIFHRLYQNHLIRGKWKDIKRPVLINSWEAAYFDFDDDKVFQEYLDYIQNPRSFTKVVRDNSELTINDKIVTLSTCLNSGDGRLLLQGVLIKDELTK